MPADGSAGKALNCCSVTFPPKSSFISHVFLWLFIILFQFCSSFFLEFLPLPSPLHSPSKKTTILRRPSSRSPTSFFFFFIYPFFQFTVDGFLSIFFSFFRGFFFVKQLSDFSTYGYSTPSIFQTRWASLFIYLYILTNVCTFVW